MARRQLLLLVGLGTAFLLTLALSLRATGSWRVAFLMGAVGAAEQTVGPGFVDKMTDALVPASAVRRGSELGGATAPASSLPAKDPANLVPCGDPGCGDVGALTPSPAAEGAEVAGAADASASGEEDDPRLRLIKMKEREQGESRMYGGGSAARRTQGDSQPEASLEASFEGMIQKLKGRASAQAAASGGATSLGGVSSGRGAGGGDGGGGADSPVLTRNGELDSRYDSPTLRALQKVNSNSAHSYKMTSDPGLEDGSKDHAGKNFDGNKNTFGDIPISEKRGAMGRKQIIVAPDEP